MKLKDFQKLTSKELLLFCLLSLCSGVMVGIAGVSSLWTISQYGSWGRLIGAILFTFAIYVIVMFGFRLFTGMIREIPTMGVKNYWQLAVCFLCNAVGAILVGWLSEYLIIGDSLVTIGSATIASKVYAENWAVQAFVSSAFCGVLIAISVKSVKRAPQKGVSATLGVIFPILIFAFCGFDHSVANTLYFFYLGEFSWRIIGYILLNILGNVVGGVLFTLPMLLKEKVENNER